MRAQSLAAESAHHLQSSGETLWAPLSALLLMCFAALGRSAYLSKSCLEIDFMS